MQQAGGEFGTWVCYGSPGTGVKRYLNLTSMGTCHLGRSRLVRTGRLERAQTGQGQKAGQGNRVCRASFSGWQIS